MIIKNGFKIPKDLFDEVINKSEDSWIRCDVNERAEKIIAPSLSGEKTLGVFASGSASNLHQEEYGLETVGGIDRLRIENNPKNGEPPINIDHYAVCNGEDPENYDVFYIRPQNGNEPKPFDHWPDSNQVGKIINSIKKTIRDI